MAADNSHARPIMSQTARYAPQLNYPQFKLDGLPDPDTGSGTAWRVCGKSAEEMSKSRKATSLEAKHLLKFHGWGIDMGIVGDATNLKCFQALWKLFYYQADKHRPETWDQLTDFTRDAGPRLLKLSINGHDMLPISRYYPNPPKIGKKPKPGYRRPTDALSAIPDSYVEQMLYPVAGGPREVDNSPGETEVYQPDMSRNDNHSTSHPLVNLAKADAQRVMESVQRTVMDITYEDLARDPSAAQDGHAKFTAVSPEDLKKAIIGSFPATSDMKLAIDPKDPDKMIFSPDGNRYPYRGRGPMYRNHSSGIDSVIVVGKLLDAGSTALDRKNPQFLAQLTNTKRAFIEATNVNWDLYPEGASRDRFWAVMASETHGIDVGVSSPVLDMWIAATDGFEQFRTQYHEQTASCECSPEKNKDGSFFSNIVMAATQVEDRKKGISMQQLVARQFASQYDTACKCEDKKGVSCYKKFSTLPMRLAVTLDGSATIKKHTRDLSFDYITDGEQRGTAAYRWLGGIYCKDDHYRVYWTDTARGEHDANEIQMYDSAMLAGAIVGGIPAYHKDEKVPESWWKDKPVPLLFYEKIENPEGEVVNLMFHTLSDMAKVQSQQKLISQERTGWIRRTPPPTPPNFPWRRLVDKNEERFHMSIGPYDPANQGNPSFDGDDDDSSTGANSKAAPDSAVDLHYQSDQSEGPFNFMPPKTTAFESPDNGVQPSSSAMQPNVQFSGPSYIPHPSTQDKPQPYYQHLPPTVPLHLPYDPSVYAQVPAHNTAYGTHIVPYSNIQRNAQFWGQQHAGNFVPANTQLSQQHIPSQVQSGKLPTTVQQNGDIAPSSISSSQRHHGRFQQGIISATGPSQQAYLGQLQQSNLQVIRQQDTEDLVSSAIPFDPQTIAQQRPIEMHDVTGHPMNGEQQSFGLPSAEESISPNTPPSVPQASQQVEQSNTETVDGSDITVPTQPAENEFDPTAIQVPSFFNHPLDDTLEGVDGALSGVWPSQPNLGSQQVADASLFDMFNPPSDWMLMPPQVENHTFGDNSSSSQHVDGINGDEMNWQPSEIPLEGELYSGNNPSPHTQTILPWQQFGSPSLPTNGLSVQSQLISQTGLKRPSQSTIGEVQDMNEVDQMEALKIHKKPRFDMGINAPS
ncbi:hypothetical protein BDV25DRAFT_152131 [Aspergillus avenaceus]|uniref:Uncharacterized protein n=1 Tax=Aspergillus avenaceus TaxID=36643 RepID=A0A5N6TZG7_ASPAV|nr:hypothetical protein BDV25DRAFT_152131 [Aspergillus avenaceus]